MSCPITISDSAALFLLGERTSGGHTKEAILVILTTFNDVVDEAEGTTTTKTEFNMLIVEPSQIPEDYMVYKDSFIHLALNQKGAEQLVGSQLIVENGQIAFRHWDFDTTGMQDIIIYN